MTGEAARKAGLEQSREALCIPRDFRDLCGGNLLQAAVLALYRWRAHDDEGPRDLEAQWSIDEATLSAELGITRTTARKFRRDLITRGFLTAKRGPHNSLLCSLNRAAIARALVGQKCPTESELVGQNCPTGEPAVEQKRPTAGAKLPNCGVAIRSKNSKNGWSRTNQPAAPMTSEDAGKGRMAGRPRPPAAKPSKTPPEKKAAALASDVIARFTDLPFADLPTADTERCIGQAWAKLSDDEQLWAARKLETWLASVARSRAAGRRLETWGVVVSFGRQIALALLAKRGRSDASGDAHASGGAAGGSKGPGRKEEALTAAQWASSLGMSAAEWEALAETLPAHWRDGLPVKPPGAEETTAARKRARAHTAAP